MRLGETRIRRTTMVTVAVLLAAVGSATAARRGDGSIPAPSNVSALVTHVPAGVLAAVGAGGIPGPSLSRLHGNPLRSDGKPELLNVSVSWCPHCASDSWSMAVALSRFGRVSGLRVVDTGTLFCTKYHASPCYPHTDGLSFLGARLRSRYLSFVEVVLQAVGGAPVQTLSSVEGKAILVFDPGGTIPAVDVGGVWGFVNSGFSPGALAGRSWLQIASSLAKSNNPVARRVDGLANLFTAAICQVTDGAPSKVCTSRGVRAAASAHLH